MKRLFLLLTICLGLCTVIKGAQVALTPDAWDALHKIGTDLLASDAFGLLLVTTAGFFLLFCAAAAWKRAGQGDNLTLRAEERARRYEASPLLRTPTRGQDLTRALFPSDPSSFMDDSPKGPPPETWRAPCGEPIAFRTCGTCGLIVIRDACGQPWPRPYVRSGFHLACGHGSACHPPAQARATSHNTQTDSGRPAA